MQCSGGFQFSVGFNIWSTVMVILSTLRTILGELKVVMTTVRDFLFTAVSFSVQWGGGGT